MSDPIEIMDEAMREFIARPLPNATIPPTTIDLENVLAGGLGCIRALIAHAMVDALGRAGYVLVPIEATPAMIFKGGIEGEWRTDSEGDCMGGNPGDVWRAMLEASLSCG